MQTGRKPKPTRLKQLEGNPGKRELSEKEPEPQLGIPSCPAFIKGAGRKEWKRITGELYTLGLLTSIDRAALAGYCLAWGQLEEVEQELGRMKKAYRDLARLKKRNKSLDIQASNGMIRMTSHGNAVMEPLLFIRKQAIETMHKFLVEFGMTPASRSRIEVEKPRKYEDPTEAFLDHGARQN